MSVDPIVIAALLAGFFGSTHCFGMCGAIVVLFENQAPGDRRRRWRHRILYNVGRLCFYALLGAIAASFGAVLTKMVGVSDGLRMLRLVAALLVIAIGANLMFDWRLTRFLETAGAGLWRRMSRVARHVLPVDNAARALAVGFIWGALPCGLVYSAVALAATTGDVTKGVLVMLAFWLGTLPALLAIGASAERLTTWKRRRWLRTTAGAIVIILGLLALMPFAPQREGQHQHSAAPAPPMGNESPM